MSKKTYPNDSVNNNVFGTKNSLTKREYFAALVMQGMMANNKIGNISAKAYADDSVLCADALIKALNEGGEK